MDIESKIYSDNIYGQFDLNRLCDVVIEHDFFKRLKYIKQLGLVNKINDKLNHTRYEHSIGVAYLCKLAIQKLKEKHIDIPNKLVELVPLAGLLHDIGHGPQSHLFDKYLKSNGDNKYYDHENRSCKIFEHIINNSEYLKKNLNDSDIEFICNMIKGEINNKINYECIVELLNNKESIFDLDKLDYLNRDSMNYYINNFINFDFYSIINGLKIINKNGKRELCHSINNKVELERLFELRFINHNNIYQDLEVKKWELSYLNLLNHNKNKILSIFNNNDFDVSEFCKLKDESFNLIKCDYKIVGNKFECKNPFIISTLLENTKLFCDDFIVNYGAGNMNPVDKINFYDEVDKIIFSHSDVSSNSHKKYEIKYNYLYYNSTIDNNTELYKEIYDKLSR